MSSFLKNLFVILGICGTGILGFYIFSQNGEEAVRDTSNASLESADYLRKLNSIKNISLDTDLFSDARFTLLYDFTQPTQAEPIGNDHPFGLN